jgi:cytochrome c oxidase subunit 1
MEQLSRDEVMDQTIVEEAGQHIHLPAPSWAPIILALGMTALCFGVVLSPVLLVIGALVTITGLGVWVYEEIKHASQVDSEDQASQSAS